MAIGLPEEPNWGGYRDKILPGENPKPLMNIIIADIIIFMA